MPLDLRGCIESALDVVALKAAAKGVESGCGVQRRATGARDGGPGADSPDRDQSAE